MVAPSCVLTLKGSRMDSHPGNSRHPWEIVYDMLDGIRPDKMMAVRVSGVGLGQDRWDATCDGFTQNPTSGMSGGIVVKV